MPRLPDRADLEALRAFDTPTICNALELVVPARRAVGVAHATPRLPPPAADLRVTIKGALAWARSNRIALPDSEPLVAVNAARDRLGLPQFTVTDDTTLR